VRVEVGHDQFADLCAHRVGTAVMDDERRQDLLDALTRAADELTGLAEMAELMGDDPGAEQLRAEASRHRLRAMALLDS
jgi:hypothetical protein